jgi:hypothetical protein
MQLFPGIIVAPYACQEPECIVTEIPLPSLVVCMATCVDAGWQTCRSLTWKPNLQLPEDQPEGACLMYSLTLESMGAHATVQVLARNGLATASASYCKPPVEYSQYPIAATADFGALQHLCMPT